MLTVIDGVWWRGELIVNAATFPCKHLCMFDLNEESRCSAREQTSRRNRYRHVRCEIVADAGHIPCVEQPDAFAALLGAFIVSSSKRG